MWLSTVGGLTAELLPLFLDQLAVTSEMFNKHDCFCNSKQITWLGNISMSFYMTHMFGVLAVQVGQQVYFAAMQ